MVGGEARLGVGGDFVAFEPRVREHVLGLEHHVGLRVLVGNFALPRLDATRQRSAVLEGKGIDTDVRHVGIDCVAQILRP